LKVPGKEAPANSVPAAAVIRRVQALIGFIGRKGGVGGENGIPRVAVKCVDMWKNTRGESGSLAYS